MIKPLDYRKYKITFAMALVLQHVTILPIFCTVYCHKAGTDCCVLLFVSRIGNVVGIAGALGGLMTFLYKSGKVNLATTISLPIVFYVASLVFNAIGFYVTGSLWNEERENVVKEHSVQDKSIFGNNEVFEYHFADVAFFNPFFAPLLLLTLPADLIVNKVQELCRGTSVSQAV